MDKIKSVIDSMSMDEIKQLEHDIVHGNPLLKKMISEKYTREGSKFCVVCFKELGPYDDTLALQFGPPGLKKQASFCAQDCLKYFLENLEQMKKIQ